MFKFHTYANIYGGSPIYLDLFRDKQMREKYWKFLWGFQTYVCFKNISPKVKAEKLYYLNIITIINLNQKARLGSGLDEYPLLVLKGGPSNKTIKTQG